MIPVSVRTTAIRIARNIAVIMVWAVWTVNGVCSLTFTGKSPTNRLPLIRLRMASSSRGVDSTCVPVWRAEDGYHSADTGRNETSSLQHPLRRADRDQCAPVMRAGILRRRVIRASSQSRDHRRASPAGKLYGADCNRTGAALYQHVRPSTGRNVHTEMRRPRGTSRQAFRVSS